MARTSRTRAFARNVAASAVYQAVALIAGFVIPRVLLVHYGSEANGLVSSIGQFIACFNLVEAGLSGAGVLALYKPIADDDKEGISAILSATRRLYLQVGGIFCGLILALAVLYPLFKPTAVLSLAGVSILVCALGARSFFEFFAVSKHRVFLTASQKVWVISLVSALTNLLNMGVIALGAHFGASLWLLYVLAVSPIFLRSILLALYVRGTAPWIDFSAPPRFEALQKRWDVLFLQILGVVQSGSPIILATIFFSLPTVSVFSVHNLVLVGIGAILGVLGSGLFASFGDVIARRETEALQRAIREYETAFYAAIAVLYAVAAVLITPFVQLYTRRVTDADYFQPLFAFLIVLNGLFFQLKTPQGMLVISAGLYRETRVQSSIQAGIIVVLGLILTPFFGLVGLAAAMIASNVYRTIDLLFFIPRHVTHLPVRETAGRMLLCLVTFALIFVPCHLFGIKAGTPFAWVAAAVLVTLYAATVTFALNFIFQRPFFFAIARRLRALFR